MIGTTSRQSQEKRLGEQRISGRRSQNLDAITLSYDPASVLRAFADEGNRLIDRPGIRNTQTDYVPTAVMTPGTAMIRARQPNALQRDQCPD
jgi:hypothetical protein